MRLIRSKGVGVYFVTQNPLDVPETVLAQLGNRVQHALRAYTPREQKAVRTAADTFRPNPDFDCAERDHPARRRRGAGLDARGQGRPVDGPAHADPAAGVAARPDHAAGAPAGDGAKPGRRPVRQDGRSRVGFRDAAEEGQASRGCRRSRAPGAADSRRRKRRAAAPAGRSRASAPSGGRSSGRQSVAEAAIKSVVRSVGSSLGRALVRGILGSLTRR